VILSVTVEKDSLVLRKRSGTAHTPFSIEAPGFRPSPPVDWSTANEVRLVPR